MATSDLGLKGFPVCVWNRSPNKVQDTIRRAEEEGLKDNLPGYTNLNEFVKKNRRSCFCVIFLFPQVNAISKPRKIILLIQVSWFFSLCILVMFRQGQLWTQQLIKFFRY
eukprot:GHVS01065439.1.p1 GENE.GHVS01065439.1~~GHVS01065439.1.p1  ORF type:complete len:110 (+),score=9.32 GHVS01065439.1:143-472(+)